MSFLRNGGRRTRTPRVLITVLALGAFQVLAMIGAGAASAASGCTFNLATGGISIVVDPGQSASIAVEGNPGVDNETPVNGIMFTATDIGGGFLDYENAAASTQCGSATTANTKSVTVLGQPSNDEEFVIDQFYANGTFPASITWAVDLGSNTDVNTGGGDWFEFWGTDTSPVDDTVTLTDNSFDINGGKGQTAGIERYDIYAGDGDDVVDASAVSQYTDLEGVNGDDWIAPGTFAGDGTFTGDDASGDAGYDQLSYGTRTTCTVIDNAAGLAGHDANCDGDLGDTGDEADNISGFEALESGSGNDTLIGAVGVDENFIPGDGDDDITGQAADLDTLDYSTSSAGMTIDPGAGTAVGQGNDTFTGVFGFYGSDQDDKLIWDADTWLFVGGDGTDVVDASATTGGEVIDLDVLDGTPTTGVGAPADSTENAIGGSGNDYLGGNDTRNRLDGGDGDDQLFGGAGNDVLIGGNGNDEFAGGDGADKAVFKSATANLDIDMDLGFATGQGDDSFDDFVEIVVGGSGNDNIVGGGGTVTANFRFVGGPGNDTLTGSGSNDEMKGGDGKDILRGVGGDDTLLGGNGNDQIFGGAGTDIGKGGNGKDTCKGIEIKKSCGKKGHPKRPTTATYAKVPGKLA